MKCYEISNVMPLITDDNTLLSFLFLSHVGSAEINTQEVNYDLLDWENTLLNLISCPCSKPKSCFNLPKTIVLYPFRHMFYHRDALYFCSLDWTSANKLNPSFARTSNSHWKLDAVALKKWVVNLTEDHEKLRKTIAIHFVTPLIVRMTTLYCLARLLS